MQAPSMIRPQLRLGGDLPLVDVGVIASALVLLACGAAFAHFSAAPSRWTSLLGNSVRLQLPARWSVDQEGGIIAVHPPSLGDVPSTLEIRPLRPVGVDMASVWLDVMTARVEAERANWGTSYRVLRSEQKKAFGQHPSSWTYFAAVRDPGGVLSGAAVLPVVVVGVDIVLTTSQGRAYHLAAWAPAAEFEDPDSPIQNLLNSLQILR